MPFLNDQVTFGGLFVASDNQTYNWYTFKETERDVTSTWLIQEEILSTLNLYGDLSQVESGFLSDLEFASRMFIEDQLGRAIFDRSFQTTYQSVVLNGYPYIALDLPEAQTSTTVNSVRFYDSEMPPALQTIASQYWFFDPTGNKVALSQQPNALNKFMTAPLLVDFTVTADPIATYPNVRRAGLLFLTHLYNNRSATSEKKMDYIPAGIYELLLPYKELVM